LGRRESEGAAGGKNKASDALPHKRSDVALVHISAVGDGAAVLARETVSPSALAPAGAANEGSPDETAAAPKQWLPAGKSSIRC